MNNNIIPGQTVLPDLENELGYGSITQLKPAQETFCWEYILSCNNAKQSYLKAYPGSATTSALANASRLLKKESVNKRIAEIRLELQRRYAVDANSIVRTLSMAMQVPRTLFVDEEGQPLEIHELSPEAAAITDIQITLDRNGKKHALPVVPEKVKAAVELAKIMGLSREKVEISGQISGPSEGPVKIYIPDNGRDEALSDDMRRLEALRQRIKMHGTEEA